MKQPHCPVSWKDSRPGVWNPIERSWHLAKPPGESLLSHRAGRSCWEAVSRCVMTRLAGSDLGRQGAMIPGLKCSQDLWVNISAYVRCAGWLLMALRVRTWVGEKEETERREVWGENEAGSGRRGLGVGSRGRAVSPVSPALPCSPFRSAPHSALF